MKAENRLKMAAICNQFYANGSDEQVKLFTTYVQLGINALQKLEASKVKKETPKKKKTTTK